jgi:MFS transporter, DHA2 family, multidrug resistance protein
LASVNSLINSRSWLHWQMLAETVRIDRAPVREALNGIGALVRPELGSASAPAGLSLIARQMQQQVAVMTFGDLFLLIAAVMLVSLCLLPLVQKPKAALPAGLDH